MFVLTVKAGVLMAVNCKTSCPVNDLAIPSDSERASRVCPKCFAPLTRIDYPDTSVEVGVCDQCSGI